MILLDISVVSEGFRKSPNQNVAKWLDAQRASDLYLCMPVLAELHWGAKLLPMDTRRLEIEAAIKKIEDAFIDRTLPFDRAAAHEYAKILAHRDGLGRASGTMDGFIAAIAKVHGATIATRNVSAFDGVGLNIIDPFEAHDVR